MVLVSLDTRDKGHVEIPMEAVQERQNDGNISGWNEVDPFASPAEPEKPDESFTLSVSQIYIKLVIILQARYTGTISIINHIITLGIYQGRGGIAEVVSLFPALVKQTVTT